MTRALRIVRIAGAALALAGLGLGLARVVKHESHELEHRSGSSTIETLRETDTATPQTVRVTEVDLEKGDRVLAELCLSSAAAPPDGALHAVAWIPATETLLFRTPIRADLGERKRGNRRCWTVGILTMPKTGKVALELFWSEEAPPPALVRAPLEARVAAYTLPGTQDRVAVGLLGLGILLFVAGLARPAPETPAAADAPSLALPLAALALLAAASFASGFVAGGATGLVASALVLAAAQIGIAAWLSRRVSPAPLLDRLALHRSSRVGAWAALLVAVVAGAAALGIPIVLPPKGLAPLEAAIAWPSGKLAVAVVALVVPVAEELFFRGLIFAALRPRWGDVGAVLATTAVFVAAHVPQNLGNPGALLAVGVTGLALGTLRAASGALWPCVLAHVLYNLALVAAAWT